MNFLTDIGANLHHDSFDADRDAVLARAYSAGVDRIVVTGSCMDSAAGAAEMSGRHGDVELYATAGLHPHHASDWNDEMAAGFRTLAQHERVVALGECGLDYNRNFSPRDAQLRAFEDQLNLAVDTQMPLFLHQRDAHSDFLALLKPRLAQLPTVVVHCFTGSADELADYVDLNVYVGITGWICDERRGAHLIECVSQIADDRLLIETDAPYLLPRSIRPRPKSRRCEPMHLLYVAEAVAQARGQSVEHIARITRDNADRCFGLSETATTD
ncbi:MAG: TatD family hydrolase [Oceanococcus sp.]